MSTLNIAPIKLLSGSHANTATTGQGCFMNVVAYLNGESQITDKSPCVCVTIRPIAIMLNDMADDIQRQRLIPFIERAMGSVTSDKTELLRRAWLAVDFANICAKYAAEHSAECVYVKSAAKSAAESAKYAAEYAEYAAKSAAESAKAAAKTAAKTAANYASKHAEHVAIFEAGLMFLDAALPKTIEPTRCVIDRARNLVALQQTR